VAERIRFYLDEHVAKAVARGLAARGADVLRSQDAGLLSAPDSEHLAFARQERRVLVTQDADFLRLHASGEAHAGIAFVPRQIPIGEVIRALMLLHDVLAPSDMLDHVEFL